MIWTERTPEGHPGRGHAMAHPHRKPPHHLRRRPGGAGFVERRQYLVIERAPTHVDDGGELLTTGHRHVKAVLVVL